MRNINVSIAAISMLFFSSMTSAAWHYAKIGKITTFANGGVYITVNIGHECGSNLLSVDSSNPGFKYIYSGLLLYEAQSRQVAFAIQNCSGSTGIFDRIESQL